jgi:hypothetical protein
MDRQTLLRAKLTAKKIQIQAFVAKRNGMGALADLTAADFKRLEDLTDGYLASWEEAYEDGHPATKGEETFNTLARDWYELKKQIEANGSSSGP